jgi:hypothetical protein
LYTLSRWKIWQLYCRNEQYMYRTLRGRLFLPCGLNGGVRWHSYYGGCFYDTLSRRKIFYRGRKLCGKLYYLPSGNIWQLCSRNEQYMYRTMCGGILLPRRLNGAVRWHSYYGGCFYDSLPRRNIFYRGRKLCHM